MIVGMFFYHFEQFRPKWATSGDFSTFAQMAWSNKKNAKMLNLQKMGQISQNIENYMKHDSWHVFLSF